jgi:hypothetical protein
VIPANKLFLGGNRSGKTTCGIVDDLIQAVDREFVPPWLQPFKHWDRRFKCRIIVPDFTADAAGRRAAEDPRVGPLDQLAGGAFDEAYDAATTCCGSRTATTSSS